MQLAKLQHLNFEKTLERKLQQIIIALFIEYSRTKKEILDEYLATLTFGPGVQGIKDASKTYFNKTPLELGKEESLKLILSIPDPLNFNPLKPETNLQTELKHSIEDKSLEFNSMLSKDFGLFYK